MNISDSLVPSARGTAPHAAASQQLVKAANAFEANFLGELLKPMREDPLFGNGSGLGGDSLGSEGPGSGSMGTIGSLASEALAQAIAKQGGLGIAKMVLSQLAPVEKTDSQAAKSLAESTCGGCARDLTMTNGATSLDLGSLAMFGEGNLSSEAIHPTARSAMEEPAGKGISIERRHGSESAEIHRSITSVKK